jgi:pimeloyl-ACP methyl ester carboxylesterase
MREMKKTGHLATYLRVPGAGHLVHDDAPGEYRSAVQSFLAAFTLHA